MLHIHCRNLINKIYRLILGLPWWLKRQRICLQYWRPEFDPWDGKIPWRRAWQLAPVFLPGETTQTEMVGGLQSIRSQSRTRQRLSPVQHKLVLILGTIIAKFFFFSCYKIVFKGLHSCILYMVFFEHFSVSINNLSPTFMEHFKHYSKVERISQ